MKTSERRLWDISHKEATGRRLTLAREALGRTRRTWCKRYKLIPSKLSQWEAGVSYPDIRFLIHLCDDYGLTLDYFYRGKKGGVASSLEQVLSAAALARSEESQAMDRPGHDIVSSSA